MEIKLEKKAEQICRICLQDDGRDYAILYLNCVDSQNSSVTIKDKLIECVPEMNLDTVTNAVICNECCILLNSAYSFKLKCLQTEMQINKYLQQINEMTLHDLAEVQHMDVANSSVKVEEPVIPDLKMDLDDGSFNGSAINEDNNFTINTEEVLKDECCTNSDNTDTYYSCSMCEYTTESNSDFSLHMQTHAVEKEDEFLEEERDPWFYFNQCQKNGENTPKSVNVNNFEEGSASVVLQNLNTNNPGKWSLGRIISDCSEANAFTHTSASRKTIKEVEPETEATEISCYKKKLRKLKPKIRSAFLNVQLGKPEPTAVDNNMQFEEKNQTKSSSTKVHIEEQNQNNSFEQPHKVIQTAPINILGNKPIRNSIETSRRKGRVWDKKDRCPYCNQDITNFSRHLFRKHAKEESVMKILKFRKGSRERKNAINFLRKEANFIVFSENIIRPVQRPSSSSYKDSISSNDYLPCKYCKGLYKKESLSRHGKTCFFKSRERPF